MDQVMMSVFSFSLGSHDRSFKHIYGPGLEGDAQGQVQPVPKVQLATKSRPHPPRQSFGSTERWRWWKCGQQVLF